MQKCSPVAYAFHAYGELLGFTGLLTLLGTIGYIAFTAILGDYTNAVWLLLLLPLSVGIASEVLVQLSWAMVSKRGFQYDYDEREARWLEDGESATYKHASQADAPEARTGRR